MKTYIGIAGFDIDRHRNFVGLYLDGMGGYLIQREAEDHPCVVGFKFTTNINEKVYSKQRKKMLKVYYSDDKEALQYLDSKNMITQDDLDKYLDSQCSN